MEFKKIIDYVEENKKEYLQKELAENKGYLSENEYESSNELLSQLKEMQQFFNDNSN